MLNVVCAQSMWHRYRRVGRRSNAMIIRGKIEYGDGVTNLVADRLEPEQRPARRRTSPAGGSSFPRLSLSPGITCWAGRCMDGSGFVLDPYAFSSTARWQSSTTASRSPKAWRFGRPTETLNREPSCRFIAH